jgi:large subunit ribosomal protein L22
MSIDEAIKQLSFVLKKGAGDVKQALLEAQEMAVTRHNVEFKSNLWVGEYLEMTKIVQESPASSLF